MEREKSMGQYISSVASGTILEIGCDTFGGDQNKLVNWIGDLGGIWWVKEQTQLQRSRLTWPYLGEGNVKS